MAELSSIDQIINFSKANGLSYRTHNDVKKHLALAGNPYTKYEFIVIELPEKDKKMHLVYSDIRTGNAGGSFAYCGLFVQIPVCKNEVKIRKRFFIDRFDFSKKHTTGNPYTDKKLSIYKENNEWIPINIDSLVVRKFLELNKLIGPLEFVSIKKSMSFIPLLYGKSWLAILINRQWLVDPEKIKQLWDIGSDLLQRAKINN